MQKTQNYSLLTYGQMIVDLPRIDAYMQALQKSLKRGDLVVDIGSGPGFFALLACQMGAGKVYAIEPDESILVAEKIARENGFSDRIEFIQELSTAVVLPERANLIISDLRGISPLFQFHIPAIVDARRRLLAPGGVLIPQQDHLFAAIVEDAKTYQTFTSPWQDHPYQLDMQAPLEFVLNGWQKAKIIPDQLLSSPQCWASLDYRSITDPNAHGVVSLPVLRAGQAHGLGMWFDAELAEGIGFSNAPGKPQLIYGQAFFPFLKPMEVKEGDVLQVDIRADLVGSDYEWSWKTCLLPGGVDQKKGWDFSQSTFFHHPISPKELKKIASGYRPHLSLEGQATRFMLDMMDGGISLEEIARAAAERFPERFPDWKAALVHAGEVSAEYAK
jgi:type I protein arginine methyltransferase